MLDQAVIDAIESALRDGKRVEVGVEYEDKRNKTNPRVIVVELGRKMTIFKPYEND